MKIGSKIAPRNQLKLRSYLNVVPLLFVIVSVALVRENPLKLATNSLPSQVSSSPDKTQGVRPSFPPDTTALATVPETEKVSVVERPVFDDFADWMKRYDQDPTSPTLLNEGVALAQARRTVMKALIQQDPASALHLALSESARGGLPLAVRELLEQLVHGQGRLNVDGVVPLLSGVLPERSVIRSIITETDTESHEFSAYVYGRRLHELTASSTEFEGVVLDNQLAVYDHGDVPTHGADCQQCKGGLGYGSRAAALGDTSAGSSDVVGRPPLSWTIGPKKVLIIRVDFSDLPGDPASVPGGPALTAFLAENEFTKAGGVGQFYAENSFGKTTLLATATPQLYRMPQTALYYAQGDGSQSFSGKIRDAARAAAAADFNLATYDRIGVVCGSLSALPGSKMNFGGVANIAGADFLINGFFNFPTLVHEIGHTFGVYHANRWKPANNATLGTEVELFPNLTNGQIYSISKEYEDRYDAMGALNSTPDTTFHFNHWFKNILGWIPDDKVQSINTSGTYRIYRFDHTSADSVAHSMALKIGRDVRHDYWVGFRRQPFAGTNLSTGAYVLFGYNYNTSSDLLVCNSPASGVDNAGLQVGQSLIDAVSGITITTVALGGTAPHEYLDIAVSFQPRAAFTRSLFALETTKITANASVTVERTGGTAGVTTVNYSTVNGTALSGTHFTGGSGTLTWADGDATTRTLTFPLIVPYNASLGARDFTVQLSGAAAGVIGTATVSLRPPGNPDPTQFIGRVDRGISSMALQPDGKLVVAGDFSLADDLAVTGGSTAITKPVGKIARFNTNGTYDKTFDSSVGASGNISVMRIQADGKILIGGNFSNVNNASPARPLLARLNSDGSLDPTFTTPDFNWYLSGGQVIGGEVKDIALQADGKIILAGPFYSVNGVTSKGLCRLNSDGSIDFVYNPPNTQASSGMTSVALDHYSAGLAGSRIFASGSIITRTTPVSQSGVVCLLPNGTPDPSFQIGAGALVALNGTTPSTENRALVVQPDGKLLVGGNFGAFNTSAKPFVVRLNSNGSVDESFTAPVFTRPSVALIFTLLLQPDGKVLVGGLFDTVGGLPHKSLVRLTNTGAIDPDWDNGTGLANGSTQAISSFLLKPDGQILAAAYNTSIIRGVNSNYQSLYSGLPGNYGTGRFLFPNHTIQPSKVLHIAVQRTDGNNGAVKLDYGTQNETAIAGSDYLATSGVLTWADGDNTPKTVDVTCLPGALPGRTFRLNLTTPSGGLLLGDIRTTSVAISYTFTYDSWRAQYFDGTQQSNSALTGPNGSFSGDGVPNLIKYALGLTPSAQFQSATNLPTSLVSNRLQLGFNRDPLKTDLIYEVQSSNDLVNWIPLARSTGGASSTNLGAFSLQETPQGSVMHVTVEDSTPITPSAPSRYLRLQVSQ